jgi:glycosyltransferase involved in cell wall biosynthesis
LSVIVPVYNGERTLRQALLAIHSAIGALRSARPVIETEIIVVDDGSTDATARIAASAGCTVLSFPANRGLSEARNHGAANSAGEVLVFIDSDAVVRPDALLRVVDAFTDPEVGAVTCLLDAAHPNADFFSQYKNLYMHYNFSVLPGSVDFLYGTMHAVRRTYFIPYDPTLALTADTDLGQSLQRLGVRILLDKQLLVLHLKRHTLWSFFKNDFQVPYEWGTRFFQNAGVTHTLRRRSYAHASSRQLASLILVTLSLSLVPLGAFRLALLLLFLFYAINGYYLRFLYRQRGLAFLAKSLLILWLDAVVMSAGAAAGMLRAIMVRVVRGRRKDPPSPGHRLATAG